MLKWVVQVTLPGDPVLGIAPVCRRFTFDGAMAEAEAWSCYAAAVKNGCVATAEKVRSLHAEALTGAQEGGAR